MGDYKIVIDAGHGGNDPGALGNNLKEKDYTLLISEYMYNKFKEAGIPVTMTRTTDETLDPTERVKRVLDAYGDNSNVIVISNHLNAGGGEGAEVVYALRNNDKLSKSILSNIEKTGIPVRDVYQRRLPSNTSKDYYFIHRETGKTQPVLVEYGFIDNKQDAEFIKNNYKKLADSVVDSVLTYIGKNVITGEDKYVVQKGDSLYSIAKKFGTTVDELKKINNLSNNLLSVGQVLKLPTKEEIKPPTTNTYTVQKGDSLYSIARKFGTTVDELKKINNLTTDSLSIGQVLKITQENQTPEKPGNYTNYIVKKGDNLYSIAREFNTTVSELKKINNLTSELLSIGQIIRVPSTQNYTNYTVQKGDSLYSIAKKFETTVDQIKKLNNLSTELLSINQVLKIPK